MRIFKGALGIASSVIFSITLSSNVWGQGSSLAAQATVCSVVLEIAARAQEGTTHGNLASGYAQDFKDLSLREGKSAAEFARERQLLLGSLTQGGADTFNRVLNGCIVTGERLGIIRD